MLDKQFFTNPRYRDYLDRNFVVIHAVLEEESSRQVYEKYEADNAQVLVAEPDGTEIDRLVGYGDLTPVKNFKSKLEKLLKSDDTLLNLRKILKNDPFNMEILAKLVKKYNKNEFYIKVSELCERIISIPDKSKNHNFPYGKNGENISLYEYAKYVLTLGEPERSLDFAAEFPKSSMKSQVIKNYVEVLWESGTKDINKIDQVLEYVRKEYKQNFASVDGNLIWGYVLLLLLGEGNQKQTAEFNKILNDFRSEVNLLRNLAEFLRNSNRLETGLKILEFCINNHPDELILYYRYGYFVTLMEMNYDKYLDKGIKHLKHYLRSEIPDNSRVYTYAHVFSGRIYELKG